jgi:hypothetical protein
MTHSLTHVLTIEIIALDVNHALLKNKLSLCFIFYLNFILNAKYIKFYKRDIQKVLLKNIRLSITASA